MTTMIQSEKQVTLGDLIAQFGGELQGDPQTSISGIAPLDLAGDMQMSFLSNPKFRTRAAESRAAALILKPADSEAIGTGYAGARIISSNPYAYFARVAQHFVSLRATALIPGVHPTAVVAATAKIAASAVIGPHVTIEANVLIGEGCRIDAGSYIGRDAQIGDGTHLHANVSFHHDCRIGSRGIIHSGAVIGEEGFGFANEDGAWIKIPQTGRVIIGDDVDIGANTTIDRGALEDTIIEDGVKLDNQIQIGHNCHIGAHTAMAGCVGVAGSAKIGKYCTFGGAAMVLGHLTIADKVHVSSGSLVSRSLREPGQYTGFYPLAKNADWEKSAVLVRNLGDMREKIRELEKNIKLLLQKNDEQS